MKDTSPYWHPKNEEFIRDDEYIDGDIGHLSDDFENNVDSLDRTSYSDNSGNNWNFGFNQRGGDGSERDYNGRISGH
jgi:hypothetical protein